MDQLEALKSIYEKGYISKEEFEQRKTQIIDQITNTKATVKTTPKGLASEQDREELISILSKLEARQLEPIVGIIQSHNPQQLRIQNNELVFDVKDLDDTTFKAVRNYAVSLMEKINKKDIMVVDANEYIPPEYPVNFTLYPVTAIQQQRLTEPLSLSASQIAPSEYLSAGIEDTDELTLLPLLGPATPSESHHISLRDSMDDPSNLVEIEPSYLNDLQFSPLEAPLLSPSSNSLPYDECSMISSNDTNTGSGDEFEDFLSHLNHAEKLHLQQILRQNQQIQLPLVSSPTVVPATPVPSVPTVQMDDTLNDNPSLKNLGDVVIKQEPVSSEMPTDVASPDGEKKKIKIKLIIYRVEKGTGAKPWKCDAEGCAKAFTDSSNLLKHLRTHTKEKPYACPHDTCNKAFAHSSTLKEHLHSHSGEKPFTCVMKGCGKQFAQNSNLRRHMRVHTGDKPYICDQCGKAFSQSSNLKNHVALHTKSNGKMEQEDDVEDMCQN